MKSRSRGRGVCRAAMGQGQSQGPPRRGHGAMSEGLPFLLSAAESLRVWNPGQHGQMCVWKGHSSYRLGNKLLAGRPVRRPQEGSSRGGVTVAQTRLVGRDKEGERFKSFFIGKTTGHREQ